MPFAEELLRQCWFLAGPTAAGKTELALALAGHLNAEIVALDSMTLYRGMNIGTAKPDPAARRRVPHHLFDILEPHEEFSLAEYVARAEKVCCEITSRGRTPLFTGGTGLYLRGLLRGVFSGPPADWQIRRRWQDFLEQAGSASLHARLAEVDAALAARLHPHDTRRIIRGLEVYELTGQPLSVQQRQPPLAPARRPPHVYWLDPPRDWLYSRIDRRVEQMFAQGLIAEVEELCRNPQGMSHTAQQALGYKEALDHLSGRLSLTEAVVTIQSRTRQFAKRQCTWFRNLVECTRVPISGDEMCEDLVNRVLAFSPQTRSGSAHTGGK